MLLHVIYKKGSSNRIMIDLLHQFYSFVGCLNLTRVFTASHDFRNLGENSSSDSDYAIYFYL